MKKELKQACELLEQARLEFIKKDQLLELPSIQSPSKSVKDGKDKDYDIDELVTENMNLQNKIYSLENQIDNDKQEIQGFKSAIKTYE